MTSLSYQERLLIDKIAEGISSLLNSPHAERESLRVLHRKVDRLLHPIIIRIRVGLVRGQDGSLPTTQPEGPTMQLTDTQQVDYTIEVDDTKGYAVPGAALAASVDNPAVATVTQTGSTFTVVAGQPGSAVVTFTVGGLTATEAIDVVAGGVATIKVTAGTPVDQPVAVPVVPAATAVVASPVTPPEPVVSSDLTATSPVPTPSIATPVDPTVTSPTAVPATDATPPAAPVVAPDPVDVPAPVVPASVIAADPTVAPQTDTTA